MANNIALITGTTGGLGSCFAEIHAKTGGDLILVARNKNKLEKQKKGLTEKYSIAVNTIVVDLAQPEAAQVIYDTCKKNGWSVDYLINNAGFGGQGDFTKERTMEQEMSMIAVNIETPTRLCKLFLPDLVKRGSGRILNVSSTAAIMPGPLQGVYYATKAYVTSWSNALWRELKGTGVTVTALMPGAMETGFAKTGGMSDTKLFANAVLPDKVAREGYDGMMSGKLNVIAGLPGWQKAFMSLAPIMPKKLMLSFVYSQQIAGSAKK